MTGRRVIVVGAGWIARRVHLPVLLASPLVDEVSVADLDRSVARRVAAELGICAAAQDWHGTDADLAVVCTPPATHADIAVLALRAGKDVVVEKPLATTADDAWRMIHTAVSTGRKLYVCYTNRYRADVRALTAVVASGDLGEVREVSARWLRRSGVPGTAGARAAGVIWDLGSHLADLVLGQVPAHAAALAVSRLDAPRAVTLDQSWYGPSTPDGGDTALAHLHCGFDGIVFLDHGPVVHLAASWSSATPLDRVEIDVVGSAARAHLRTVFGFSPDRQLIGGPALEVVDVVNGRSRVVIAEQSREPVEYTDQLGPALAGGGDGDPGSLARAARSVAVCEALVRSADHDAPVRFDLDDKEIPVAS